MEIYYIVIINILVFSIGYFYGKNYCIGTNTTGLINNKTKNPIGNSQRQSVSIDETKVVTKIDTSNLEKKYDSIGDTKNTQDNISSAINKLKNMKG
jgi:hypothetical protein